MTDSLPPTWTVTSLRDICVKKVPQGPPTLDHVSYIDISSIDRTTKRIGETKLVTIQDAPTRARQWVRAKDVLVSMTRPNLNAVAQVHDDLDGAVASTGFDVLRPVSVVPEWVFYRVRTNEFIADVCKDLQGVVYPAIRPHDVRRHQLPLPPMGEQHRIVEAIESYFTRLDDAVATLERVQRNLKRYRASVLKAAVEGRLVPTEAELARATSRRFIELSSASEIPEVPPLTRRDAASTYEPASVLLERILAERRRRWEEAELARMAAKGKVPKDDKWKAKYQQPAAPDTADLPELPEGWCWVTADQLLAEPLTNGRSVKTASSGFPVLRLTSLREGLIDVKERKTGAWTAQEAEPYLIQEGDFLVSRGNGSIRLVGLGGLVRALPDQVAYPDTMIRFRLCDGVAPGFFAQIWNSRAVRDQIEVKAKTTAGIFKVNQSDLESCLIPLPPKAEQGRVQAEIERLLSGAEAVGEVTLRCTTRCNRLRQSILKWAFEGRLVDQDPTDEPASALLERIRAERLNS